MLLSFTVPLVRLGSLPRIIMETNFPVHNFIQLLLRGMQVTLKLDDSLCVPSPSLNHILAEFLKLLIFLI